MLPDPEILADLVIQTIETAIGPVIERLTAAEARLSMLGDLRDRVVTVETRTAHPPDLSDVRTRIGTLETQTAADFAAVRKELETLDKYTARVEGYASFLQRDVAALGERAAVLETRPPLAGPAGKDGEPGPPGQNGVDGKDGTAGLTYVGVYQDGKSYEPGDMVTWAGSSWHCNEPTTTRPGDGSKAWTLMVKRGRDGKDGRDAVTLPTVSIGGRK